MKRSAKRALLGVTTVATMGAALIGVTTTSAYAIDTVPCGPSDYLRITVHNTNGSNRDLCFANGGWTELDNGWVTQIATGNNRVQWYGDGRWQPDQPIDKWTTFTWPHQENGVNISGIKIV